MSLLFLGPLHPFYRPQRPFRVSRGIALLFLEPLHPFYRPRRPIRVSRGIALLFLEPLHPFYRPRRPFRVSRGIALLFLGPRHSRWGWGWSVPHPGRHYPPERRGTHCAEDWVDPRAGLCGRKISPPTGSRSRTVQLIVAIPTELPDPLM